MKENELNNGTAIKVRGIDANGNSITTTPKEVGTGEEVSGFTFKTSFTKADGTAFTPANAPTTTGCKLTYADVKSAGGNITGYIQGTKS